MKLFRLPTLNKLICAACLLVATSSASAQNETIKNIAQLDSIKNPVAEQVSAESALDAKLQALAEREKNLQERLIAPEESSNTPKTASLSSKEVHAAASSVEDLKTEAKDAPADKSTSQTKKIIEAKKEEGKKETVEESSSQKELASAKMKIQSLLKELDETKSRLIISETEVERLASLLESRNVSQLEQMNVTTPQKARVDIKSIKPLSAEEPMIGERATKDIPIATVIAPAVSLKLGPSLQSSTLSQATEGMKLPVEGSQGGWYRVVSPSGARAWIPSQAVTLGKKVSQLKEELGMDDAAYSAFKTMGKVDGPEVE